MIARVRRVAGHLADRDRRGDVLPGDPAVRAGAGAGGRARWPAPSSPRVQGAVVGYWHANPIVLTIAAGFAIGGAATWFSGGTPVYPHERGVRRAQLDRRSACRWRCTSCSASPCSRSDAAAHDGRPAAVPRRREPGRGPCRRPAGRPGHRDRVGLLRRLYRRDRRSSSRRSTPRRPSTLGGTLTLDAIAAVLVGGTAITGGRGSAVQTLGGAVLIAVISDVLLLRGYSTGVQILVKGILVLAVVVAVHLRTTRGAAMMRRWLAPARPSACRRPRCWSSWSRSRARPC